MRELTAHKKETVVLKLSGSLFFSNDFERIVTILKNILRKKKELSLVVVTGGGKIARDYIAVANKLGADRASLDEIGIQISRLNALVLILALGSLVHTSVPTTLGEIVEALEMPRNRVVVVGGLHPGQSTNAVAALIAEKVRAKIFVNATDIDGVFTKDPRRFKDAKLLHTVTANRLAVILADESMHPGGYDLMDPIALKLVTRSHIATRVLKCDPEVLQGFFMRHQKHGTEIVT